MSHLVCWQYLLSVPTIGRKTIRRIDAYLAQQGSTYAECDDSLDRVCYEAGCSARQLAALKKRLRQVTPAEYAEQLAADGIGTISLRDAQYPAHLRHTADPPLVLFYKGDIAVVSQQKSIVSIVGTRKPTSYGLRATQHIVAGLSDAVVVSGFMYGIDAAAHEAAVQSGLPTVGVLGFGFGHMFPTSHRVLFETILAAGGVFITEYPPGTEARAGHFPERNRIVAGMSDITVVVEAGERSGTSITARLALDEGREVAVVPGSIFSRYSIGTARLLAQGAAPVRSGSDVMQIIRPSSAQAKTHSSRVFAAIQNGAQSVEEIMVATNFSADAVLCEVLELELEGFVRRERTRVLLR